METNDDRMTGRNVLISGASAAGPALAYWLARRGFRPTIVERAPALRDGGYAVDIRGVALDVAGRMGIIDQLRAANTDTDGMSFVNSSGKRIANLDNAFGVVDAGDIEIMRGDLAKVLYARTRNDTEYIFDDSIAELTETADGVAVEFERGKSREFDVVIGADGLHSNVRRLVFGDESPFIRHLGGHIAIFTSDNFLDLDRDQLVYAAPNAFAMVRSAKDNVELKVLLGFGGQPVPYDRRNIEQQQRILRDRLAGKGWILPRLLDAMSTAPDFFFDSISQVRMPSWSAGRVALLGDAAFGPSLMSGQGTSLALVGAYVLAGELATAASYRTAFGNYERHMREFVTLNQDFAVKNSNGFSVKSPALLALRNLSLRMLPYLPWKNAVFKAMTTNVRKAANGIELNDYRIPATR